MALGSSPRFTFSISRKYIWRNLIIPSSMVGPKFSFSRSAIGGHAVNEHTVFDKVQRRNIIAQNWLVGISVFFVGHNEIPRRFPTLTKWIAFILAYLRRMGTGQPRHDHMRASGEEKP